ncbi:hypothetical protein P152DRAFT_458596 [Eremomyces bilateralis CBS 781.70]|uniref:Aminoglycoside phosphotransferase domain-containing protein n=1 Tax=Eremomyces bilateralis CBS 781.70 TaxID=1392243 RepID=A0A6G1G2H7_9PEZI|nr:uncharacterized protein P152DRAFT_458596 [Eremomyces bilateralis CBS 781.70]KAF1812192.1 hypothetical protein P152DRAFT_458596 [Eremomyces bilateralis CBS 781.70]
MGGLNIVRRLDFHDGTSWVARLQLPKPCPDSLQRLMNEIHTIQVIREQTRIPVPEIFAYGASCNNAIGVAFMIMEFIPADTAMDSFGGWSVHRGKTPPQFRKTFYSAMTEIQVSREDLCNIKLIFRRLEVLSNSPTAESSIQLGGKAK